MQAARKILGAANLGLCEGGMLVYGFWAAYVHGSLVPIAGKKVL
jgi:hypothetical protein